MNDERDGQDLPDGLASAQQAREAFLAALRVNGWNERALEHAPELLGAIDGGDIAAALIQHWRQNPTLGNFAEQLNDASAALRDEKQKLRFIAAMNLAYIHARQTPPETLPQCYSELLFWDGCDMPEARAYFEMVGKRFAERAAVAGAIGPELGELLQTRQLSPQMKELRRIAVDALRENLRGCLAKERFPAERLKRVLAAATGVGGARLVNETIWDAARQSVEQGAGASADSYLQLREMLNQAADGPMLDQPRETLNRISHLLKKLDAGADFGVRYDAGPMLQYWRSRKFRDIPDKQLYALFEAYLRDNPNGLALLRQDKALLEDRQDSALFALLDGKGRVERADDGRRKDGFSGREKKKSFDGRKVLYVAMGAIVVVLLFLLAMMLPNGDDKKEKKPTPTVQQTKKPEPKDTEKPTEKPESTEEEPQDDKPQRTEKTTEAPSETPAPTPTPTPTPSPTSTPTATPLPSPSPAPEESAQDGATLEEVTPDPEAEIPEEDALIDDTTPQP